jgi:RNA polymerase sigma-70 factor (ECF subfamily)
LSTFTEMDDRELADFAKTDYAAFDELYRRYVVPVYRYCYARTDNTADAEDLTAQTFLAALEGLRRYHGRSTFPAWLFGVARHKCADFYRKQYSDPGDLSGEEIDDVPELAELTDPEARVSMQELLECVENSLTHITLERLEALRLRYWGGLRIADIARVTQRSQAAVKMLISRAISDLRERCVTT